MQVFLVLGVLLSLFQFARGGANSFQITTIAGTGVQGISIDGDVANLAKMGAPSGMFLNASHYLFVCEGSNGRVRKINLLTGIMNLFAGTGGVTSAAINTAATSTAISKPSGVWADSVGNVYITDFTRNNLRKVGTDGLMNTVVNLPSTVSAVATSINGDGGPPTAASLHNPCQIAGDSNGHIYVADQFNFKIRKYDPATNTITTIAGTGVATSTGDNSLATSANLKNPYGAFVDSVGNVYVTENVGNCIRVIDNSNIIRRFAGTGVSSFSGDGDLATSAAISTPYAIWGDSSGTVFFADGGNARVRLVTAGTLVISTVAGTGETTSVFVASGLHATAVAINTPNGVYGDADTGRVFVSDSSAVAGGSCVRALVANTAVPTVAPTSVVPSKAPTSPPSSTLVPSILPTHTPSVIPTTVPTTTPTTTLPSMFPTLTPTFTPSYAPSAQPSTLPSMVPSVTPNSIPQTAFPTISRLEYNFAVVAGALPSAANNYTKVNYPEYSQPAVRTALDNPQGMWLNSNTGDLYIVNVDYSDYHGNLLRVRQQDGILSVVAGFGNATMRDTQNIAATSAYLKAPLSVWGNSLGELFITELQASHIRKIDTAGIISNFAGRFMEATTSRTDADGDGGPATSALINMPGFLCGDIHGNVYFPDAGKGKIRKVDIQTHILSTVVGDGHLNVSATSVDLSHPVPATSATLYLPIAVWLDSSSTLFIVDALVGVVHRVHQSDGLMVAIVGTGKSGFNGDHIPAVRAQLSSALSIAGDTAGNIYVSDSGNNRIRVIYAENGLIDTLFGEVDQSPGLLEVGDSGGIQELNSPVGLCVDLSGNLYVSDEKLVHKLSLPTPAPTIAPTFVPTLYSPPSLIPSQEPSRRPSLSPTTTAQPSTSYPTIQYPVFNVEVVAGSWDGSGSVVSGPAYSAPALSTKLGMMQGLWSNTAGTVFAVNLNATDYSGIIVKVNTESGILSVAAGSAAKSVADMQNIAATSAFLLMPVAVWGNSVGELYIAEQVGDIRKVDTAGIISNFAGRFMLPSSNRTSSDGDGGLATSALIGTPALLCTDSDGNVIFPDAGKGKIRKIDIRTNIITTIAGTGVLGAISYSDPVDVSFHGPATSAVLYSPIAVWIDSVNTIYISDSFSSSIFQISSDSNVLSCVAGTGMRGFNGDNLPARETQFSSTIGLGGDDMGNIFVVDGENGRVRVIHIENNLVSTIIAVPEDEGQSIDGALRSPISLHVGTTGAMFLSDLNVVRRLYLPTMTPTITPSKIPTLFSFPTFLPSQAPSTQPSPAPSVSLQPSTSYPTIQYPVFNVEVVAGSWDGSGSVAAGPSFSAPALQTKFDMLQGLWSTTEGTVYVTNINTTNYNNAGMIMRVSTDRIVTVAAGSGPATLGGMQNIAATSAYLYSPVAVWGNSMGDLYIAEMQAGDIRKVDTTGIITVYAGQFKNMTTSRTASDGDGGPATSARIGMPALLSGDRDGNVIFPDAGKGKIRKIDSKTNIISTLAGTGGLTGMTSVDVTLTMTATAVELYSPVAVWVDSVGVIYITDTFSNAIFQLQHGFVSHVAGTGVRGFNGDNLPATLAEMSSPTGLAGDAVGNLYFADSANNRVRVIHAENRMVSTVLTADPSAATGDDDYLSYNGQLKMPIGLQVDSTGSVYISDKQLIRKLYLPTASPSTAPSTEPTEFKSSAPTLMPVTEAPTVQPSEAPSCVPTSAPSISLQPSTSYPTITYPLFNVEVVAGSWDGSGSAVTGSNYSAPALETEFDALQGLWTSTSGDIFVTNVDYTDYAGRLYRIAQENTLTVVAGSGPIQSGGTQSVAATSVFLFSTVAVWGNTMGELFISEMQGSTVRKVDTTGLITTYAGQYGFTSKNRTASDGDGGYATAAVLSGPALLCGDTNGDIYIPDTGKGKVRKISYHTGRISTIVGTGTLTSIEALKSDGPATSAELYLPISVWVDSSGVLYFTDAMLHFIRQVKNSYVTTIVGTGETGFNGDNLPGKQVQLSSPLSMCGDSAGNLYFIDTGNNRVRVHYVANDLVTTVLFAEEDPSIGYYEYNGELKQPIGLQIDSTGSIIISDMKLVRKLYLPSVSPTISPSQQPTIEKTMVPTLTPTISPTVEPTRLPTELPTTLPTVAPSFSPSLSPSESPSVVVTTRTPSSEPSTVPSTTPSIVPSTVPTTVPSTVPNTVPSSFPETSLPTSVQTETDSSKPSELPTRYPSSLLPSLVPSQLPSLNPNLFPTQVPSVSPSLMSSVLPSSIPTAMQTSLLPSLNPSAAPVIEPTTLPSTTLPSLVPIMSPSVSNTAASSFPPTSAPTHESTDAPTAQPTTNPTTQEPSLRPTAAPSMKPSVSPTQKPSTTEPTTFPTTVKPSRTPSIAPTRLPTVFSSVTAPTMTPTAEPTSSQKDLWTNALQSALFAQSLGSTAAHQSTYYELLVTDASPKNVYGSCASWSSLLNGDVSASIYSYKPSAITLTVSESLTTAASSVTCSDATKVSSVLNHLISSTVTIGSNVVATCDTHSWVAKTCAAGNKALCVDCPDPCAVSTHCKKPLAAASTTGLTSNYPFVIAPCVSQSCSATNELSAFRVLSVSYNDIQLAPDLYQYISSNTASSSVIQTHYSTAICASMSNTTLY